MSKTTPIIFTHGAGTSIYSDTLQEFHTHLSKHQFQPSGFNFDYMQTILDTNKRRPPEKMDKLIEQFNQQLINHPKTTCIAGKSMGGRVATLLAAQAKARHLEISHVFVWGYPFFAPKKNEPRIEHFNDIQAQVHIFQGTRDSFGKPDQINKLDLPNNIHIHWIEGADHDFNMPKRSNLSKTEIINNICQKMRHVL